MFNAKNTIDNTGRDMHAMINDAEKLLSEAAEATGDKASALHQQGMDMLSASIARARDLEQRAIGSAKAMAKTTDAMVQANPWRSVAGAGLIGAGLGLVLGMALARE